MQQFTKETLRDEHDDQEGLSAIMTSSPGLAPDQQEREEEDQRNIYNFPPAEWATWAHYMVMFCIFTIGVFVGLFFAGRYDEAFGTITIASVLIIATAFFSRRYNK